MQSLSASVLVKALPMPCVLLGADERVAALNADAMALLETGAIGRHYITALRQPSILDRIEQCFAQGGTLKAQFLSGNTQNERTWSVSISSIEESATGRGVLLCFTDMSDIEHSNQMRKDFVSNVSHELRTPLTSVLGFVETLRGAAKEDATARERFLSIIDREAGRMARLVDDLLSLSRIEDLERRRPSGTVDVNGLIVSVLAALSPLAEQSNVRLVYTPPGNMQKIPGDAEQLQQVLSNLIENAIKYGGKDRQVTVELGAAQPEPSIRAQAVRISVTDQGDGIPDHQIGRLTERFYRLDSHRSRDLGGTGLGLAIVKHIVNRHRGRLRISSTLGQGSTFAVILPATGT